MRLTLRNKLAIGTATYVQPSQLGLYPPVVDENSFFAVQTRIAGNEHQTIPRAHSEANLFTGVARGSRCGATVCRFTQRRNGKTYRDLVCSDTLHKHGGCGMTSIRYDHVEASFGALLSGNATFKMRPDGHGPAEQ